MFVMSPVNDKIFSLNEIAYRPSCLVRATDPEPWFLKVI